MIWNISAVSIQNYDDSTDPKITGSGVSYWVVFSISGYLVEFVDL